MADEKAKIKDYSDRYKELSEELKTAKKNEDAQSLQNTISALDSWATEVKEFIDSLNGKDITNDVDFSNLYAIYNKWAKGYTRATYVEELRRITTREKEAEAEEKGVSTSDEYNKIVENFSPETRAVLSNNVSNYVGFNINPVKADYNTIVNFLKEHRVYTGSDRSSSGPSSDSKAAAQQGNTGGTDTKLALEHKQTLDAFFTNFDMNKQKQSLQTPPEEEEEEKEPELDISKYTGSANVNVDNLVSGLSSADEVGYAKSTLDGTEDALKDTEDYITARDKNLTKEEEKQYRADLEADAYGRNARINDNIARGSKGENANNRNFETTLRYSRLADALNNRVHVKGGRVSTLMGATAGGTMGVDGELSSLYQMPKIETEEMRQMDTIRGLSKDQSGRQINRQQNYRDAAQELTAAEMQDKLKLQTELSERLMDRRDKFTDEEMRQWYQTRYDEEMRRKATEWEKKFGRDFGIESARFIAEMNKEDPTLAAIMGKAIDIVPPDYVQQFLTEVLMPYGRALRAGESASDVIERLAYDFGNFASKGLYGFTKGGAEGIMDAIREILS